MSVLYRKYRPQNFNDLIGQNHIKITLQHEIERGEIGHAYLFCGPRGLGKTTTARLFAKSINCENKKDGESEPCNKCSSCLAITGGSSVDVLEMDAASNTGVENVRENIIESVRFTPNQSKYKVFIIDEVHMLSNFAFNALLKTLEEPPTHTIFVLCTTEIHKIPQTIISRCQRFDFKRVSADDMLKRLEFIVKKESKKVAEGVLKNIIVNSDGCLRDAESLLGKIFTLGDDITVEQAEIVLPRSDLSRIISLLNFIVDKNATAAIESINKLVEDGIDLQTFTENLIEFLRKLLLIKINGSLGGFGIELDEESNKAAVKLADRVTNEQLISLIEIFLKRRQEIKSSLVRQFPLELAVVEVTEEIICRDKDKDDFNGSAGGASSGGSVKGKIKERISNLSHKKTKSEIPLSHTEIEPDEERDELKVDLLAKNDKVSNSGVSIDFKKIEENWNVILNNLLEKNYTLSALLRISEPLKCRGNVLEIGLKSNFYKERLEDIKHKEIIESVISEVIKASVKIMGVVKEDLKPIDIEEDIDSDSQSASADNEEKQESAFSKVVPPPVKDSVQDVIDMF